MGKKGGYFSLAFSKARHLLEQKDIDFINQVDERKEAVSAADPLKYCHLLSSQRNFIRASNNRNHPI